MCKGGGGTQTATSTSQPPAAVQNAYSNISNVAEQAASAPLQQYSGPLLAGFSPLQNTGFQGLQGAQNIANPYLQAGSNLVNQGTQNIWNQVPQFNQQNLQQYMSPYNQDVVNATLGTINDQNAQQQNSLRGNAIASGAWGGDRAGVAQAALAGQQDLAKNQTIANLNNQNYAQGLGQFNQQQGAQLGALSNQAGLALQGAGLQGYLGQNALSSQLGATGAQLSAGQQQQNLQQNALNIPYQQFLQQQAYPFQTTQFLANTLLGTAGTQGGTSSTTQPAQNGNVGSQILGLGLGVAGLFSGGGAVPDVDVNFIPMGGMQGGYGGGGLPAAPEIKQPESSDDGLASILAGLSADKGMFSGKNPFNSDIASPGLQNAIENGNANDYLKAIQNAPIGKPSFFSNLGNMFGFDSGGAVVNLPEGSTPAMPPQAREEKNFNPVVAGTPVYSFAPPGGVQNNNSFSAGIPNSIDYSHLKNFSVSPLLTQGLSAPDSGSSSTNNAASLSSQDFFKLLSANPGLSNLFGGNYRPDSGRQTIDQFSRWANRDNINSVPLANDIYQNYLDNSGKYGFADGGDTTDDIPSTYIAALGNSSGVPDLSESPLSLALKSTLSGNNPGMNLPAGNQGQANNSLSAPPSLEKSAATPGLDSALTKVDPGLALSTAGFAMASGKSPNFLANVGEGAAEGLKNYMQQKKDVLTAQQKAQQLASVLERGNWSIGEVTNPDGTKKSVAFNSKDASTKDLNENIKLQGKEGGRGNASVAKMYYDNYLEAHKGDPVYKNNPTQLAVDALDYSATKGQLQKATSVDEDGNVTTRGGALDVIEDQSAAKTRGSENEKIIAEPKIAAGKEQGKTGIEYANAINDEADKAFATKRMVAEMKALGKDIQLGNLAPAKQKLGAWAVTMGIDPDYVDQQLGSVGSMQAMGKLTAQLATQSMKQFTSRGTQMEFTTFLKNNPNMALTPDGFNKVIGFLDKSADLPLEKQDAFMEWKKDKQEKDYQDFSHDWNKKMIKNLQGNLTTDSKDAVPIVMDQATYDAVPSGQKYKDPSGNIRTKP